MRHRVPNQTIQPHSNRGGASVNHARYVVQRGRCFYCGARKTMGELTQDHVLPRRKGGTHAATNVALACLPCNIAKDDRLPTQAETRAAALSGAAVQALQAAWQYFGDLDLAHMGNGQLITAFVDKAMTGKIPDPMESADE